MNKKLNTISINKLKELIKIILKTLWEEDSYITTEYSSSSMLIPPIMIWGAPGVGKSTAIRELSKELNIGFIDVRLAQREPVDMRGLPVPDENSVKWLVSDEWPRNKDSRGIIMFDELTAADKTLQVAAYEFILDRKLGNLYNVPNGWYIVAAGNRVEDRAVSCAMSSALANRFLHVEVAPEVDSFLHWANKSNLHQAVINFILYRPALLFSHDKEDLQRGWPSPRSWERVSTMLKIIEKNNTKNLLKFVVSGLIGNSTASEFLAFYKDICSFDENLNIQECLLSGKTIPLPQRADKIHVLCGAVAFYLKMEVNPKKFNIMCENFLKFGLSLSSDYAAMLINDALSTLEGTKRHEIIIKHPLYTEFLDKHIR